MEDTNVDLLIANLEKAWPTKPSEKATRYVGQFFNCQRLETRISGKVHGNHGIYTITVQLKEAKISSACSCYIGKHGFCHHCEALARTFIQEPSSFQEIETRSLDEVNNLVDLGHYLQNNTLDSMIAQLKSKGITQKAFAESIGMNSRHLSSIKSSERRNRFYNELGATKLAVLWVLEHIADD